MPPGQMRMLDPSRPTVELYDLQSDPDEFNNLAGSPAHREVFDDLGLQARYGERIPVLRREDSGAELDWPFDAVAIRAFIA